MKVFAFGSKRNLTGFNFLQALITKLSDSSFENRNHEIHPIISPLHNSSERIISIENKPCVGIQIFDFEATSSIVDFISVFSGFKLF